MAQTIVDEGLIPLLVKVLHEKLGVIEADALDVNSMGLGISKMLGIGVGTSDSTTSSPMKCLDKSVLILAALSGSPSTAIPLQLVVQGAVPILLRSCMAMENYNCRLQTA